ncbi:hypothetical protein Enr13x_37560 [Stieleria neptunia]|uniref:Uncharacterized protein n=1 Tax=Stieleria neptunia TaxID=2527979 RepID=A0A518HST5_9BACT|nr:hypothetical protein [Stieleria neptunia]QDV43896.1 hypothetical protein Enr13x_37560 [Stieleria neptunia]
MAENEREFFENLVDTVDSEVNEKNSQKPRRESTPQSTSGDEQSPNDKVAQPDFRQTKKRIGGKREMATASTPRQTSEEMLRTFAKATVQKTVRFQPKLIADLEAWQRKQETMGEIPASFQRIQNEALRLWLEKHSR